MNTKRQRNYRWASALIFVLLALAVPGAAAPEKPVRSGWVEVDGGRLFYEEAGDGQAVVLLHGGLLDRRMWDDQFQLFAQRYRVIRYDIRGFGKSSVPLVGFSHVDDLERLLESLQIEKAILVGLSLGGYIALDFALTHPERVSVLVLAGPGLGGYPPPAAQDQRWLARMTAARDESPAKAVELWLQDPFMVPAMENPQLATRIRQLSTDNSHVFLVNPLWERDLNPPAASRLTEIRVPTLILVGTRDVQHIHAVCGILDTEITGAKKVVIPGAGHMVNMEKPGEFNRAVLDFLASLQEK